MSRIRTLKPEFFRSRSLARVSRDARLTFQGLWSEADDAGRGVAHSALLKGAIWPLDDDITAPVIDDHLAELEREHIRLYEVDGDVYYLILNWEKHQAAAYRKAEPKYPPPPETQSPEPDARLDVHGAHGGVLEGKGREGNIGQVRASSEFDAFWAEYPHRVARKAAVVAFDKARKEATLEQILKALDPIKSKWADPRQRQFVPHPASWLNAGRWMDEVPKKAGPVFDTDTGALMSSEAVRRAM